MTNIRDFTPGTSEQRGLITVSRYPDHADIHAHGGFDHDEFWTFTIPVTATVNGQPQNKVWLRLHANAITAYDQDEAILSIVAAELLQMGVNSDPDAALPDGRKLAELKPEDLYAAAQ